MAAVYNVPLGGALFAVEVLLGTLSLPVVLPAVAMSAIATVIAWVAVPDRATYLVPVFHVRASQVVWAVIIGPLAGLLAVGWVRAIATVNTLKPRRWGRVLAPIVIFTALGAVSITYPQILGNGKDTVALALTNQLGVGLLVALLVLKPFATAACLGQRGPRGPVHAHAHVRGTIWGPAWPWLGGDLARRGVGQLRDHRRSGGARSVDAGPPLGGRPDARAHAHRRRTDGADLARGRRGHDRRPRTRRPIDLFGPTER